MTFPIGDPLEPSLYLYCFSRYSAAKHVNEHANTHTHSNERKNIVTTYILRPEIVSCLDHCLVSQRSDRRRSKTRVPGRIYELKSARSEPQIRILTEILFIDLDRTTLRMMKIINDPPPTAISYALIYVGRSQCITSLAGGRQNLDFAAIKYQSRGT